MRPGIAVITFYSSFVPTVLQATDERLKVAFHSGPSVSFAVHTDSDRFISFMLHMRATTQ